MNQRQNQKLKKLSLGIVLICLGILCFFALRTRKAPEVLNVDLTEPFSLERGVYQLHLLYHTDKDMVNAVTVVAPSAGEKLRTNTTVLYKGLQETNFDFWLDQDAEDVRIEITQAADSHLDVQDAYVVLTNGMEKRQFGMALGLVLLILVGTCLAWPIRQGKSAYHALRKRENRMVAYGLLILLVVASLPLMVKGIYTGADATFHLLRIEGTKEALLSGQIPVRIEPNWLQGHGYASGMFYSDFFLVIPAVLRCLSFDVMEAYKAYQLIITCVTILLSYWCFYRIANERRALAYVATACYSLSIFRLIYMYSIEGVGQYTALTFFPLVAYGVFRIYGRGIFAPYEKTSHEKFRFLPLTLGMAFVIQSHVLSVILLTFFLVLTALCFAKWTFQKETFLQFVTAAVTCFLLQVWYFLPMLEYSHSLDFAILEGNAIHKRIQTYGMYVSQLFTLCPKAGLYGAYPVENGPAEELHYTIGLGLILVLVLSVLMLLYKGLYKRVTGAFIAAFLLGVSVLSLWMATYHFPWDAIADMHPLLERVVASIQFQTRFQSITVLCISLLAIWVLDASKKYVQLGMLFLVLVGITISSGSFVKSLLQDAGTMQIYDETCMGNGYISGGEYILLGTDLNSLTYDDYKIPDGVEKKSSYLENGKLTLELTNRNETAQKVQVPLLYYPGYVAKGYSETNSMDVTQKLAVLQEEQKVAVEIPAGFTGKVVVRFQEPLRWRLYDGFSLLIAIMLVFGFFRCQGRGKTV